MHEPSCIDLHICSQSVTVILQMEDQWILGEQRNNVGALQNRVVANSTRQSGYVVDVQ